MGSKLADPKLRSAPNFAMKRPHQNGIDGRIVFQQTFVLYYELQASKSFCC